MTVTPYDFYHMTGLRLKGATISLDDVSGIQLGLNMLGRKYSTETIRYSDLVSDYMLLPQRIAEEHVRMARAFVLHLLGAYLFATSGQTVSLRWLTLFQDFGEAQRANWGQACLAYHYSTLDTLTWGILRQLVGLWDLLEFSSLFISCISICSL
ncbi:protein MAIN-LIKE 1-like [Quercus lobata]|uniref:protein MAIN-LIKE 1-like n=1 Tax=Quercus lobata TaxID=97700 RepID=UPI0012489DEA|nr:protein MAIN-LIKE 1-like [Quercus lobata]